VFRTGIGILCNEQVAFSYGGNSTGIASRVLFGGDEVEATGGWLHAMWQGVEEIEQRATCWIYYNWTKWFWPIPGHLKDMKLFWKKHAELRNYALAVDVI
jgi:hypothetical protein